MHYGIVILIPFRRKRDSLIIATIVNIISYANGAYYYVTGINYGYSDSETIVQSEEIHRITQSLRRQ